MIRSLRDTDRYITKQLFNSVFHPTEESYFREIWNQRDRTRSVGLWREGVILGAALVRKNKLEYIFVSEHHQGDGIGTELLTKIIDLCPNIYLNPVDAPSVITWYERNGFHLSSSFECTDGTHRCYVRTSHSLRSR